MGRQGWYPLCLVERAWSNNRLRSRVGVATQFRFRGRDPERAGPVQDMEPYMGMAGHAEFVRSDLAVFAHIHPAGTAPMAALASAKKCQGPHRQRWHTRA